jgi:hypothetical protein
LTFNNTTEILKLLKVRNLKIRIIAGLCLVGLQTLGQGVPKAYEPIYYKGKADGRPVKLMLANAYIDASTLEITVPGKNKPRVFEPETGVADEHNRLKFVAADQNDREYFILDNMQEAYEETPKVITGIYYLKGKKIPVKLGWVKHRKK